MNAALDPKLLARAREVVADTTGFREDAIAQEAVERVLRAELARGRVHTEVLSELQQLGSPLAYTLVRAVLVGETYFFRQPEHFRFIAQEGIPSALRHGAMHLRGWSAGCATGEEAYSLAACLLGCAPAGMPVEVVGTDLHEASLEAARRGTYGAWSRRESAPALHSVYEVHNGRQVSILPEVRRVTRFAPANLLAPLPERFGQFDFILCRNVLTYFSPSARDAAITHLSRALTPGGLLFLGTVEVDRTPPGLTREGPPELQAFRKPRPEERTFAPTPPPVAAPRPVSLPRRLSAPLPTPPPVAPSPPPPPARLHLQALERIEEGNVAGATAVLELLVKQAPDYLPGLLELALLRERAGARDAAFPLMRALRTRAGLLPPDTLVDGPEALPARFYLASADAYLNLGALE
ncbi:MULTISPECIES: protein-glutamate O-methyltransferase CheR [Corallococcus]|uniref:CheR family methyltransferase n=1 Tax=Corallococcus TaxID=83461 RepID=UPI00117F38AF|nr:MULTISPECIES: CheR family methyltransferase [Corallococcus]NBD13969.1 methyltransferase domain-containing protein [Corallococcus silvisoli]TSC25067.1 methyltransferase domain-containing protein [Corallococcus sp. Z5C101001]